ncbi:MAG: galactose oxidase-like domain-containing protein [Actinomycetota bacterium]
MRTRTEGPVRPWQRLTVLLCLLAVQVGAIGASRASADPTIVGQWDPQMVNLGVKGIHSILLPNGTVLLFSYPVYAVGSDARVWDPVTGNITDVSLNWQRDAFCAGHSQLPDGRQFLTGGHVHLGKFGLGVKNNDFFDAATNTWTSGPLLSADRWYPTNVALGDGRTLIFSGDRSGGTVDSYDFYSNTITRLPTSATRRVGLYPKMHLMPSGKIIWDNTLATMLFDPATNTWSALANTNFGSRSEGGTSVLLPGLNKVLIAGGSPTIKGAITATATAEIIDLSAPSPQWRYTTPMNHARVWANAVLLPDGTVLMVGGGTGGSNGGRYSNAVRTAELFDPVNETWTDVAAQVAPRIYHSTAVLLPDGRVLTAGQDSASSYQFQGEIYSPPYLFKGPRPTITSAPSSFGYGQAFTISSPDASAIGRVALIRPGSVTHSVDFDQRYVDLSFTAAGGDTLNVTSPPDSNQAPPGYYMLFIVDSSGVPSVASWVHIA